MTTTNPDNNEFLRRLTSVTEANLTNPHFGVSMLAKEIGMSRSNLHRKVNSELKISVSQFINHIRLKKAKEILRHTSDTVSEVAYKVGFNSVSYFIKCFHEYYGYSPGQVGNREEDEDNFNHLAQSKFQIFKKIFVPVIIVTVLALVSIIFFKPFQFQKNKLENKIAVLPPDNLDIRDSYNSTDIDGIIQSIIDNLSKINDVNIVSPWQSVLQYRNKFKPAPEIAKERRVNYLVKPRIHSIHNKVTLSFNLIDGPGDKLLETFVHEIDSNNVSTVHQDIIKDITDKLDIPITTTEHANINKLISSNKKALNYYWQGVETINRLYTGKESDLEEAKTCFEKAIEYDNECASAYAQLAFIYYLMDFHWMDQHIPEHEILYGKEINNYADKAMLYDSQSDLSLIAKALFYINEKEYEMAILFLKKALIYNPHSYLAIGKLCEVYSYIDENEKFIEYALKVINSNLPNTDTVIGFGKERLYLNLGAKYRDLGFFEESLKYHDLAIDANPDFVSAIISKSQVIFDLEGENNYQESIDLLLNLIKRDSTTLGYPFLGLSYYLLRDYQSAYNTFKKILENSEREYFSEFPSGRFAVVLSEMGEPEKAQIQINYYREFAESSPHPQIKNYRLIGYYSFKEDTAKALEHLKIMSQYDHLYFRIRMLRDAPIYDNIRELPQFQQILSKMETRWQAKHDSIRDVFEKKGLL